MFFPTLRSQFTSVFRRIVVPRCRGIARRILSKHADLDGRQPLTTALSAELGCSRTEVLCRADDLPYFRRLAPFGNFSGQLTM